MNTRTDRTKYFNNLVADGLVFDIWMAARTRVIDSAGAAVAPTALASRVVAPSLSGSLKQCVDGVTVKIGDQTIIKHDQLSYWFKYRDSIRKDLTEDEALSYWTYLETESNPEDSTWLELIAQNTQKAYWLGMVQGQTKFNDDKYIIYSAQDHFLLPNNELPLFSSDKFDLTFTITNRKLFVPVKQHEIAAAGPVPAIDAALVDTISSYHLELYDIDIYVAYYEWTDEQRMMF